MTTEEMRNQLLECFLQKKGVRVVLRSGKILDLVARSLNIVGMKDGFSGTTSDQAYHKIMFADVTFLEVD